MTLGHPVVERYLTRFDAAISEFEFAEREEVTREIRNHIAEAQAAGRALDAVLQALGPADVLARAYAVELALNPQGRRRVGTSRGFLSASVAIGMRPVRALARLLKGVGAAGRKSVSATGRLLRAVAAAGLRAGWALGRLLRTVVAAGMHSVRVLGRLLRRVVAAGMRSVWVLGRFLRTGVAAGMRAVRGIGGFLRGVVAAGVRPVLALGGFLSALVAAGARRVWALGGVLTGAVLVAALSVAALIVGMTVAAVGVGATLSGLYLLVAGTLEAAGFGVADAQIRYVTGCGDDGEPDADGGGRCRPGAAPLLHSVSGHRAAEAVSRRARDHAGEGVLDLRPVTDPRHVPCPVPRMTPWNLCRANAL